jgi:hypothetical protein
VLLPVAVLGFTMLARWRSTRAASAAVTTTATGEQAQAAVPAERHFPVPIIAAHGVFAVATVVLVLLAALEIGG